MDNVNSDKKEYNFKNYKIIEYVKSSVYIIEDIVSDEFCKKYIDFINKLHDEKNLSDTVVDENYSVIKCNYIELDRYNIKHRKEDMEIYNELINIFGVFKKIVPDINLNGDTEYLLRKIYHCRF